MTTTTRPVAPRRSPIQPTAQSQTTPAPHNADTLAPEHLPAREVPAPLLVTRVNNLEAEMIGKFGSANNLQALMIRQSEIFNVAWENVTRFPDVRGALLTVAQWSWTYGAMPRKHVYLLPFAKKEGEIWRDTYSPADSYEWRRISADQKALEMKWSYMVQTEPLSLEEIKAYAEKHPNGTGPYHIDDIGYRSRVLFQHEIQISKAFAIPYNPSWHLGFWRRFARFNKRENKFDPDNIPTHRTPQWVAEKRAAKSALAQHFELREIENWQQKTERQRYQIINSHAEELAVKTKPLDGSKLMPSPSLPTDENGDIIFYV